MTLYTFGYARSTLLEFLDLLRREGIALVVDVRRAPHSRWAQWSREHLEEELGERYTWLPKLGNAAGSSDEEAGLKRLEWLLRRHGKVLLLCVEPDHRRCHRARIAEQMAQRLPGLQVIHV